MRHHTSSLTASTENVAKFLATHTAEVSAHYVVGTEKDKKIYQLYDTKAIAWHAGESEYDGKTLMNQYSIGIEIMSSDGLVYDDRQRGAVMWLTKTLMYNYNIPATRVIRHKDVTSRKRDVGDNFWNNEYKTFKDVQLSLAEESVIRKSFTDKELKYYQAAAYVHSKLWNAIPDEKLRKQWNKMNNYIRNDVLGQK